MRGARGPDHVLAAHNLPHGALLLCVTAQPLRSIMIGNEPGFDVAQFVVDPMVHSLIWVALFAMALVALVPKSNLFIDLLPFVQ